MQDNLQEIVQLVGRESLSEDQKVVIDVADIIIEDFLAQNAFSTWDFTCPLTKSVMQEDPLALHPSMYMLQLHLHLHPLSVHHTASHAKLESDSCFGRIQNQ
jgi:vacuolar-type H+-ATPase catalytic subunit A/Vma1